MFLQLVLVICAVLAYFAIKQNTKPRGFPPGPTGLPLVGYLPFLGKEPEQTFLQLRKKYGDVMGCILGERKVVVLSDLDTIKEAYREDIFSGRLPLQITNDVMSEGKEKGLVFTSGTEWHTNRRFTLRHLRDFGFGKKSIESVISREVTSLLEGFKKEEGKPINLSVKFHMAILNTIWRLVASKRFEHDDPKFLQFFEKFQRFNEMSNLSGPYMYCPWLYKLMPTSMTGSDMLKDIFGFIKADLDETIEEHRTTLDADNMRDLIDAFLIEISKTTDSTAADFKISDGYLSMRAVMFELFVAGADTTSGSLQWFFKMLLKHPHVKERILEEMQQVVGLDRMVTLADRSSMPYTEATILETLRYSCLVPLFLPHALTDDKVFRGYRIPKGTIVLSNLLSIHFDPKRWPDPHKFDPERFLTSDGRLKRNEALVPFSTGKRICIGEKLAQDELFLFSTNILQKLDISLPPGESLPAKEYIPGLVRHTSKYNIVFQERA